MRVARGAQDGSIVVATRSGALLLCELAGASVDEIALGNCEVAGLATLTVRQVEKETRNRVVVVHVFPRTRLCLLWVATVSSPAML